MKLGAKFHRGTHVGDFHKLIKHTKNILVQLKPFFFYEKEPLVNEKAADIFVLYQSTSSNCFRQMERNFEKPKEDFPQNKLIYNNIFQYLHRCHGLG